MTFNERERERSKIKEKIRKLPLRKKRKGGRRKKAKKDEFQKFGFALLCLFCVNHGKMERKKQNNRQLLKCVKRKWRHLGQKVESDIKEKDI